MKPLFLLPALLLMLSANACKKQETSPQEQFSDCLEAKFEAFKQNPDAASIIQIQRPQGTLYWLRDVFVDTGEEVVNEDCELICTADCECDGSIIVLCDETHLDFPMVTIWQK